MDSTNKEVVFEKNHASGLALQPPRKNWGSFFAKKPYERQRLAELKTSVKNKGKLHTVARSFKDLNPKEFIREKFSPYEKKN